ncbi:MULTISPECIES: adenylosuccinate lyase family protein [unclassified Saccharopolyspora]|uniref:class-II fumarase/aspartase family protein n=1 Tax=unclassified Saccharopolyspora TaxID=2646250 RepID=UPI001CD66E3A|nr:MULTISPECIES: adenylosuccinate lyase family protein [unclassified Saccharopolyspora]MCA1184863.1 adenylosuccinate lyase family protein [Saccharopolyspora sp. 6T]MCA1190588.1 adenylosuccinate lyase family protein [Saccharopolyspora sp. 6V]MCA1226458.1 adenylosuccinate lyase family protein [Saccharopolyspora sp. 6M]MCA1283601.1 adenylosuccinate lyase family protein [Saccharopolyspora sp. 7B]
MSSTVFDSVLYREMFSTGPMREVFSDASFLARMTETESALARAQATVGVVPAEAARIITDSVDPVALDLERLRTETENVGYPVLPLVTQLAEQCGEAGGYLHWGATTQDIMDTATMLQCRDGLDLVATALDRVRAVLRRLAAEHVDSVAAGRTHLQHALPVTFGFRCAVWVSALDRHAERLAAARERDLMVQFGGAAGTLASLGSGPEGLAVRAALAAELGLRDPEITWHVARDGLNEIVSLLAAIGGSLGKIGWDVTMLCSSEFGEVAEPFVPGRGASSTMPQKRNPISSELMVAAAKLLRDRAATMLDAMMQDFERATGPWHLEWATVPEAFQLAASSLHQAEFMLGGLEVDVDRMRANTDLTGGLIVAEAVMMAVAPELGRQRAHEVVYDACRRAIEGGQDLATELRGHPELVERLGERRIDELCDPANYLGSARAMTRGVVGG